MNDLPVLDADIQNYYLQVPLLGKHQIICGAEFGLENEDRIAPVVRLLYGGNSDGADFWRYVRPVMADMYFESCKVDLYQWMRPGKISDWTLYCQFVLLYTDNIFSMMEDPERFLCKELGTSFTLKKYSIGPQKQYLGKKVFQETLGNETKCWAFSSYQYIQNVVNNVEDYLDKKGEKITVCAKST